VCVSALLTYQGETATAERGGLLPTCAFLMAVDIGRHHVFWLNAETGVDSTSPVWHWVFSELFYGAVFVGLVRDYA